MTDRAAGRKSDENADARLPSPPKIPTTHLATMTEDASFSKKPPATSYVLQAAPNFKLKQNGLHHTASVYDGWGFTRIPPERLPFDESLRCDRRKPSAQKGGRTKLAQLMACATVRSIAIFRLPVDAVEEGGVHAIDGLAAFLLPGPTAKVDGFGKYPRQRRRSA